MKMFKNIYYLIYCFLSFLLFIGISVYYKEYLSLFLIIFFVIGLIFRYYLNLLLFYRTLFIQTLSFFLCFASNFSYCQGNFINRCINTFFNDKTSIDTSSFSSTFTLGYNSGWVNGLLLGSVGCILIYTGYKSFYPASSDPQLHNKLDYLIKEHTDNVNGSFAVTIREVNQASLGVYTGLNTNIVKVNENIRNVTLQLDQQQSQIANITRILQSGENRPTPVNFPLNISAPCVFNEPIVPPVNPTLNEPTLPLVNPTRNVLTFNEVSTASNLNSLLNQHIADVHTSRENIINSQNIVPSSNVTDLITRPRNEGIYSSDYWHIPKPSLNGALSLFKHGIVAYSLFSSNQSSPFNKVFDIGRSLIYTLFGGHGDPDVDTNSWVFKVGSGLHKGFRNFSAGFFPRK